MAGNNELRIGAAVDTAQLNAGFNESAAATAQFVEKINISFVNGRAVSQRAFGGISDDVKQMAANVGAASLRVAEATRGAGAAQQELRRVMVLVKDASADEALSTRLLAAAQEQGRVAALELAEAQKAVAVASHASVSGVQATSAAIRSLEGNAGLRAVENFLAKTLGLGPALQAIFPIIGALAFGKILFDMGEKVYEVEQKAAHASEKIDEAYEEQHAKAQVNIDDLTVQADKLQDNIDKIEGHPNNGLQTALDEARKMADKLLESLKSDRKELEALLKENNVGAFGSLLSGVASTSKQKGELLADNAQFNRDVERINGDFNKSLATAGSTQEVDALTRKKNQAITDQYASVRDTYRRETQRLQQEQAASEAAAAQGQMLARQGVRTDGTDNTIDNSAKISNVSGLADKLDQKIAQLKAVQRVTELQEKEGQVKQDHAGDVADHRDEAKAEAAARKAAAERYRGMEQELRDTQLLHENTVAEEYDFWQARIGTFAAGSEQYDQISSKLDRLATESANKAHELIKKRKAEDLKSDNEGEKAFDKSLEGSNKWATQTADDVLRTGARWDAYFRELAKGQEVSAAINDQIGIANLKALQATGGITALGVAQQEAALHARQNAAELKALREELERLEAAATRNALGNVSDPKVAAQIAQVKNQITQVQGKGQSQSITDQSAVNQQIAKPYLTAFNSIEQGWLSTQRSMLTGSSGFGKAMQQLWGGIALDAIGNIERIGFNFVRHEILMTAQHAGQKAAQLTTDATGAAASTAIARTGSAAQGFDAAKLAFKNTYAQVSSWPLVGPVLAPVLAAGAFTAVAAFEQGTMMIPREGAAVLHPGEAVLGSPSAAVMRDALSGRLGGGGDQFHVHLGGNSFSAADGGFHSQFQEHETRILGTMKQWHREGKLNFARAN